MNQVRVDQDLPIKATILPPRFKPDRSTPSGDSLTSSATSQREHLGQPISGDASLARGLLDRDDLLQRLDRAVSSKQVTVISAPPGSGKTSMLRAWADRSTKKRRVAFVSVDRDQQDAQQFWSAVLDAVRSPASSVDPQAQPDGTAPLDSDQLIETVLSEFAEQAEPVVPVSYTHLTLPTNREV